MKKFLKIVISALLILSLTGCALALNGAKQFGGISSGFGNSGSSKSNSNEDGFFDEDGDFILYSDLETSEVFDDGFVFDDDDYTPTNNGVIMNISENQVVESETKLKEELKENEFEDLIDKRLPKYNISSKYLTDETEEELQTSYRETTTRSYETEEQTTYETTTRRETTSRIIEEETTTRSRITQEETTERRIESTVSKDKEKEEIYGTTEKYVKDTGKLTFMEKNPELFNFEFDYKYAYTEPPTVETEYRTNPTVQSGTTASENKLFTVSSADRQVVFRSISGYTCSITKGNQVTYKNNTTSSKNLDCYVVDKNIAAGYIPVLVRHARNTYGDGRAVEIQSTMSSSYATKIEHRVYEISSTTESVELYYSLQITNDLVIFIQNTNVAKDISNDIQNIIKSITVGLK